MNTDRAEYGYPACAGYDDQKWASLILKTRSSGNASLHAVKSEATLLCSFCNCQWRNLQCTYEGTRLMVTLKIYLDEVSAWENHWNCHYAKQTDRFCCCHRHDPRYGGRV